MKTTNGQGAKAFDYITQEATKVHSAWGAKHVAQFHYFNAQGMAAKRRALADRAMQAVEQGKAASGVLLVYGTFGDTYSDTLSRLAMSGAVRWAELRVVLTLLQGDIDRGNEHFDKIGA